MAVSVALVRPDDLLNLQIDGENLRLDTDDGDLPALILDDPSKPGFLIVRFPPQTIIEEAVYQSSPTPPLPEVPPLTRPNYNNTPVSPPSVPLPAQTRYRAGQSSRLVFRIDAGSPLRIPYTFAGLLDWSQLELSLAPLAELPPQPTLAQRLAAPDIAPPTARHTAIELPYHIVLSPNADAAWRNVTEAIVRNGVVPLWHTRLVRRDAARTLTAEISRAEPAPLRAIWSPDFNRERFSDSDEPRFGKPDKGWAEPVLLPMTPSDRHEIVALTCGFSGYVRDTDDFRWYEPRPILASRLMLSALGGWLSSRGEWDPPATYKPPRLWQGVDVGVWNHHLKELEHAAPKAFPVGPFVPPATHAAPAQGAEDAVRAPAASAGSAVLRTGASAQDAIRLALPLTVQSRFEIDDLSVDPRQWADRRGVTGVLLNLSEWSHIATLGRDHYVRIVYEGFLYPLGHRAALIKITERRIVDDPERGTLAHLYQRMFIVVRQPLRNFADPEVSAHLEDGGRGLPFQSIRLTTLITPDIADPNLTKIVPTGSAFWVRLGSGASAADNFKFHGIAEDIGDNPIDFSCALVFVPNSAITASDGKSPVGFEASGIPGIKAEYDKAGEARLCAVPGQKLTLAEGENPDNKTLVTHGLYFTTHAAPVNKRFGGFLPRLFKATVQVPAIDLLVGSGGRPQVALHEAYLKNRADNVNDLFAKVVKETTPGVLDAADSQARFAAKDAGGLATPDLAVSALTGKLGPLAGKQLDKLARDEFDAADFFGAMANAKLFGTFPLKDLVSSLTAGKGAPKLHFVPELGPPPKLVGELTWQPEIKDTAPPGPAGSIVRFEASKGGTPAELTIHARIVKLIGVPAGPADVPTTTVTGTLANFSVELLRVVKVQFDSFSFKSQPGQKPDVNVALDKANPVDFLEDLSFVQTLKDALPPDLFGDGPSLEIDTRRIKAGFAVGLPPLSVGVFSLRDMSFGAFLELPFADGKPLLDFAFCRREKPFNLTVAFLGGGGFFHLQTDTDGVKLLEAALEFGASAAINLGVASGGVHIMAGIYFSLQRKGSGVELTATLGGYLRMGGELSVLALISVSLEFYLAFTYTAGKAHGIATLTVKVEVLCFSTSVAITVEKTFGGSAGDPVFRQTFTAAPVWLEYADAFA